MCMALVLFSETYHTAAYSHLHKKQRLGLHVTDECLEQFFVCFPTLLRLKMNLRVRVLYQFQRNNISVVLTHWYIGSVTIC